MGLKIFGGKKTEQTQFPEGKPLAGKLEKKGKLETKKGSKEVTDKSEKKGFFMRLKEGAKEVKQKAAKGLNEKKVKLEKKLEAGLKKADMEANKIVKDVNEIQVKFEAKVKKHKDKRNYSATLFKNI